MWKVVVLGSIPHLQTLELARQQFVQLGVVLGERRKRVYQQTEVRRGLKTCISTRATSQK